MNNADIGEQLLSRLKKLKEENILVIVEGKKDREALASLGITNVFSLDRWPLYKVVEHVAEKTKDCVILTDLDEEGKKIFSTLHKGLSEHGVRIDNRFREFLFRYTSLRQIEGLAKHVSRLTGEEP
jgi:5S rRNA maturation endonuclease (ribonuclease M5)